MTHVPPDLHEASPIIISESRTHVVIAIEVSKVSLLRNLRFIQSLEDAATRAPDEDEPR